MDYDDYKISPTFAESSFTLIIAPDSTNECQSYRDLKAQLEKDYADAMAALKIQEAATKGVLSEYRLKYEDLKKRQEALVKQYEDKSKSITAILLELDAIKQGLAVNKNNVIERAKHLSAKLVMSQEKKKHPIRNLSAYNQALVNKGA